MPMVEEKTVYDVDEGMAAQLSMNDTHSLFIKSVPCLAGNLFAFDCILPVLPLPLDVQQSRE
jgi:hypothetical protein